MEFKNKIAFTALATLVVCSANAQFSNNRTFDGRDAVNTITTGVPFLMIGPDSRSGGMGDAGVAATPDANSIHWNPSKLAFLENDLEFSLSYSPWLRNLVPDMNLSYLSGVKKLNDMSAIGASLRYFTLGDITFTDEFGTEIMNFRPNEFALDFTYAMKLSDRFSMGITGRFIQSQLTGGVNSGGEDASPGRSVAADLSAYYVTDEFRMGDKDAVLAFGLNISNIGAKISYGNSSVDNFLPTNMRLGSSLSLKLDEYNKINFLVDANKLLVPTPPVFALDANGQPIPNPSRPGSFIVDQGMDPNVGVVQGMFQSFVDAPGGLGEELREINLAGGIEYVYAEQFALRGGYFWEHETKGNRQYFTIGAGLRYNTLNFDVSYLIATEQRNPLARTLRFSLRMAFESLNEPRKKGND
ncbi:MAG: type IX secretion system outer membrane channel protein PorV [Luteibaculaceae bacterium]